MFLEGTVIRVGVVGTGVGVMHVENFQGVDGVEVAAVCSAQLARAEATAARFNISLATDDYRTLIDAVDAVVVTTPPALHAAMTLDAIAAGKHVFCEKPLSASLSEARAMRDALNASGLTGMVNFQIRFAPAFAQARQLLDEGRIGGVGIIDSRMMLNPVEYLQLPGWSDSKLAWFTDAGQAGGLLTSSAGPHLIDFALWYGGPIVEVAARTVVTQPEVALAVGERVSVSSEDGFVLLARHANGVLSTIRGVPIGWQASEFTVELHGDQGSLIAERVGGLRAAFAGDAELRQLTPSHDAYDRMVITRMFIDAIRGGGPSPSPNFDDGVAAQSVIEAAKASADSGDWVAVEPA
jgi:predicted dehydrogenase